MDAFYASVEQRDRPELKGRPVVVGGSPNSRGVVCAASYEARVFGIHSAMPTSQAYRLCRHAVFLKPEFSKYKEASQQIRAIFARYTDAIEPLSLDEAYLDVTENKVGNPSATLIAESIRRDIFAELNLTASAGVAPCKFLAKVASDINKPNGQFVIPPSDVAAFLAELPVRKVPGIGKVTEKRLLANGIETCGDLLPFDKEELARRFGSAGASYYALARGIDPRRVCSSRTRKSCSVERTFAKDLQHTAGARETLATLADELERRLEKAKTAGKTVVLKVKYSDFTQVTRSRSLPRPVRLSADLLRTALELLADTEVGKRPVRLLGIGVSQLGEARQLVFPFMEEPQATVLTALSDPQDRSGTSSH